ncbi:MAG: hypothetical protein ACTMIR_06895 [Cellulomonadaceae bacterium]
MGASRKVRVVRGAVTASAATFVALLAHLTGGGALPGLLGVVVPLVLSLSVCALLAGRRLSPWRLTVSVAISQALFHLLFVLGTPAVVPASTYPGHTGHTVHTVMDTVTDPVTQSVTHTTSHAAGLLHLDATMILWHGLAAITTIIALSQGERALLRLRELTSQLAARARRRLPVAVAPILLPLARPVSWAESQLVATCAPELSPWRRRGPPLAPAV